jgi:methyl-accepting chemotaxis protein
MRRVLALGAAVIALSVAAAGCGGSDDGSDSEQDPTAAWASDFCSAVTTWTDDLQGVTSEFTDTSNLSEEGIQSAADDVKSSTQTLVDDLRGLGAPPTDSGDAVKTALDDLSTTLEDESTSIQETAQGVSGLAGIATAISSISTSLATMATSFSAALTTIQDADAKGELQGALQDSPECADISNG